MVEPTTALAAAKQINGAVGLIEKLFGKVRAKPDIAALKLSEALDEIVKTYWVVDDAFNTYASLALDQDALNSRSKDLFRIAGGSLAVHVEKGRGSCHNIFNIYHNYLKRWFEKIFNKEEQSQLATVFIGDRGLGDADETFFEELYKLTEQLGDDAITVRELVEQNKQEEARKHVLSTYKQLAPVQREMAKGMQRLFALKNRFIQIAGTS